MECSMESLLYWESKQRAKRLPVVNTLDQKETIKEIRETLKNQGFSEKIIADNIKMALELLKGD